MKRTSREAVDGWRRGRRCIARNIARLSDVATRSCIRRMKALPRLSSPLSLSTHRDPSLLNLPLFVSRNLSFSRVRSRRRFIEIRAKIRAEARPRLLSREEWLSPPECSAHYATERVTISGTSNISSETNAQTALRIPRRREISFRARSSHSIRDSSGSDESSRYEGRERRIPPSGFISPPGHCVGFFFFHQIARLSFDSLQNFIILVFNRSNLINEMWMKW